MRRSEGLLRELLRGLIRVFERVAEGKKKPPVTRGFFEPPDGIEPSTYSLRGSPGRLMALMDLMHMSLNCASC